MNDVNYLTATVLHTYTFVVLAALLSTDLMDEWMNDASNICLGIEPSVQWD